MFRNREVLISANSLGGKNSKLILLRQKQPPEVFYKKVILKSFAIFTGKHPCWSLFLIKQACNFIKNRLQHRGFRMKTTKFLRTTFLKNTCERLLFLCRFHKKILQKKCLWSNSCFLATWETRSLHITFIYFPI